MTVLVWPREDRPAVRAKGTVRPSAKPRVKSERKRLRGGSLNVDLEVDAQCDDDRCGAIMSGPPRLARVSDEDENSGFLV